MGNLFIKELEIKNFRCFKQQSVKLRVPDGRTSGSGLNVLVAENGLGKTTILESINLLTQSGFSIENRINIGDFHDFKQPMSASAKTEKFTVKASFNRSYVADGISFEVTTRKRKSVGKILSGSFSGSAKFRPLTGKYNPTKNGDCKEVDGRDLSYLSDSIDDDDFNIFFFDKNRARHAAGGTFKTVFDRICDDLNWKFLKNLSKEDEKKLMDYANGESDFFSEVSDIAQKGVGEKLAGELSNFFDDEQYKKLRIDLLRLLSPFSNAFFSIRDAGSLNQVSSRNLGSGVEIMLTLLLLRSIYAQEGAKGSIIFLIDEPELHLHPIAQKQLAELLLEESRTKQIVIATHSPYLLKPLIQHSNFITIKKDAVNGLDVQCNTMNGGLFPWSPSWGEITYKAFNMPTVEFHNELYGFIQDSKSLHNEKDTETYLLENGMSANQNWTKESKGSVHPPKAVTLPTYVRHSIHHPENTHNVAYTFDQLKTSIDTMMELLKK